MTEGDKVAAEAKFGFSVNGYGVGDLVAARRRRRATRPSTKLCAEYEERYARRRRRCARAARGTNRCATARGIELGLRAFLEEGGFKGFTDYLRRPARPEATARPRRPAPDGGRLRLRRRGRLENLRPGARDEGHGRRPARRHVVHGGLHLPSRARTAIWCSARTCWKSARRSPPASRRWRFIRSASAARKTRCGWSSTRPPGAALNASLDRPRQPLPPDRQRSRRGRAARPLPKLPVARAVWECRPDFKTACAAWILRRRRAPHRLQLRGDHRDLEDFATIAGIELASSTPTRRFRASSRNCATTKSTTTSRPGFGAPRADDRSHGYTELKREDYEAESRLAASTGLVDLTFGNVSAVDRARASSRSSRAASISDAHAGRHGAGRSRWAMVEGSSPVLRHADAPPAFLAFPKSAAWSIPTRATRPPSRRRAGRFRLRHDPCRLLLRRSAGHAPDDARGDRDGAYEWETGNVIVERFAKLDPGFPRRPGQQPRALRVGTDRREGGRERGRAGMHRADGAHVAAARADARADRAGAPGQAFQAQARARRLLRTKLRPLRRALT